MAKVLLPPLAEGVDKANISYWHRAVGDAVKEGEDLVELVTDKATFNMPAPHGGILKEILVAEGSEAKVGEAIAIIE
jgi:pyruvate/2-oxoglutarate dehydrogenase complex dihydrolipoamide acyltransferase (E2) component